MFDKQNRCLAVFANLANTVKGTFVNLRISVATHIWHIVEDVHLSIDFSYQVEDFRFHLSVSRKTEIYDRMPSFTSDDVTECHTWAGSTCTLRNGSTIQYNRLFLGCRKEFDGMTFRYTHLQPFYVVVKRKIDFIFMPLGCRFVIRKAIICIGNRIAESIASRAPKSFSMNVSSIHIHPRTT